jgi:hypothetical protein
MKMRNVVFGDIIDAEESTDSSSSSYGQKVLIEQESGQAIDRTFFEEIDLEASLGVDESAVEFQCGLCRKIKSIDELHAICLDNIIVAVCLKCSDENYIEGQS